MNVGNKIRVSLTIIFLGLAIFGITSNGIISTALGETDSGISVGVKGESDIKVGESDEEQSSVSTEEEAKVSSDAQTSDEETEYQAESESELNINTSYPRIEVSVDSPVAIQTHQMLYIPGDEIRIEGSVWSDLAAEIDDSDTITIQVLDSDGALVEESTVQVESDGTFEADIPLPEGSASGEYTITSKIDSDATLLGSIDTTANLEATTQVLVSTPTTTKITVQGHGDYEVGVASNSKVSNVEFNESEKKITFRVEGETGTKGVTQISIPKAMLSGQMTVMIDGQVMSPDNVIATANSETTTTLELNYHHSSHTIDIVGTSAVPEFGTLASIIMVVATSGIIVLSTKYRIFGIRKI